MEDKDITSEVHASVSIGPAKSTFQLDVSYSPVKTMICYLGSAMTIVKDSITKVVEKYAR